MELAYKKHSSTVLIITLKRLWLDELKGDLLHPFCLNMLSNSKNVRGSQNLATEPTYPPSYEVGIGCS
jgi:hypothetical protein